MSKQTQKTVVTRPAEGRQAISRKPLRATGKKTVKWSLPLNRKNFLYMAIGLGVIILGFILMFTGVTEEPAVPQGKWNNPLAVTIAPILLVIGYCVVIPYAIMKFFGKKKEEDAE